MGRRADEGGRAIRADRIERFLDAHGHPGARITSLRPLGEGDLGLKEYGYGKPLQVTFESGAGGGDIVLRTMTADPFGHDRRADRVAQMVLSHDTFGSIPRHVRPLAVGALDAEGELVSIADGEPFLVTEYVGGALYADDLGALKGRAAAGALDLSRAEALAEYLAALHREPAPADAYQRALRDVIGSGEGIFGLTDSYPADHPIATPTRLEAIELAATAWRWRLRGRTGRARRIHGDFHPFNILFREGTDLSVLDASRGVVGDPADDVTCLSVNYLFFALTDAERPGSGFTGPHRALWDAFWARYLHASGDRAVLEVVAPFFAWRLLVVASPVWYPHVADSVRDRLLRFAERLLDGAPFEPRRIDEQVR